MTPAQLDQALDQLISKFPARYGVRNTEYLLALLKALAEGDGYVSSQVEAVRDNLLVITASGKHLDRLASLYGVVRGVGAGVQDDDFKRLIPTLGKSKKQVFHAIQSVIDAVYGPFASHANTTCSAPAPYPLMGASLRIKVDGEEVMVVFESTDALDLSQATAEEVATAISKKTGGRAVGSVTLNTRTGERYVTLRTSTIGSQGFIQVLGGDAQTVMRFPEIRPTRQKIGTWDVSRYLGTDEIAYSLVAGESPAMRTAQVKKGDFVTIRFDSGFSQENTGTFEVSFVEENSFRVRNPRGKPEPGNVTQAHTDDFTFFRPDLGNILLAARPATVLQTATKELTVILPVTSPIVKRTLKGGHHFHGGLAGAVAVTENTLTLGTSMGFPDRGAVRVISSRSSSEGVCSSVSGNTIVLVDDSGWPDHGAAYSPTTQTFYFYEGKSGGALTNVTPTPPTTLSGSSLKYSHRFSYDGISGNVLQNVFPNPSSALGFEVASEAGIDSEYWGSFLYDTTANFICSENSTKLDQTIQQGSSNTIIQVQDASAFDESGHLVFEFATKEQEGPIRYLGKVGDSAIIVDPGHVFVRDHLKGTMVRTVRKIGAYLPKLDGTDYAVYLTGTSAARSLVAQYIADITAAGIVLKFVIEVPPQKWPVIPLLHSTDPLATELATFED